ncbi:MAG: hypothetical protein CSA54_04650 [Gammaproteobacteria bacterium]|nr:MAG: hypothetical protein CSA54_04650 [Gammaproteobacteria bacterium]
MLQTGKPGGFAVQLLLLCALLCPVAGKLLDLLGVHRAVTEGLRVLGHGLRRGGRCAVSGLLVCAQQDKGQYSSYQQQEQQYGDNRRCLAVAALRGVNFYIGHIDVGQTRWQRGKGLAELNGT